MSQLAPVEPGFRIAIPPDWAAEFGVQAVVSLEKTARGILIRSSPDPARQGAWDDVFADKLVVNSGPGCEKDEVTGDDLLF